MKQKVKTFFHVFKNSLIPNSSYYKKVVKTHFSFSLKYFIILILILNLFLTFFFLSKFRLSRTKIFLNRIIKELQNYPPSLVIKINNGSLSSTLEYPYFFWGGYQNKRLWLVIDESATPNNIIKYNSYFLLTKKNFVKKLSFIKKSYQVMPLTKIGSLTISNNEIRKIINFFSFIEKNLLIIYLFSLPLFFIFTSSLSFIVGLIYLLIISFIVYQIFHYFFHRRIHFKKILQIGFHSITTPLFLDYLFFIKPPQISFSLPFKIILPFPIAFLILLLVFVFCAVYETYHNDQKK